MYLCVEPGRKNDDLSAQPLESSTRGVVGCLDGELDGEWDGKPVGKLDGNWEGKLDGSEDGDSACSLFSPDASNSATVSAVPSSECIWLELGPNDGTADGMLLGISLGVTLHDGLAVCRDKSMKDVRRCP